MVTLSDQLSSVLLRALKAGKDLKHIISDVHEIVKLPIAIFDLNPQVIAETPEKITFDGQSWTALLHRELLDTDVSLHNQKLRFILTSGHHMTLSLDGNMSHIVLKSAKANGIPDGIISVFCENASQINTAEFVVDLLCRTYSFLYHNASEMSDNADIIHASLSKVLLQGSNDMARLLFSIYGETHTLQPGYIILELRVKRIKSNLHFWKQIAYHFVQEFPNSYWIITEDSMVAMLCDIQPEDQSDMSALYKKIELFMKKGRLYCGISLPFHDLESRMEYKQQAHTACELGIPQNPDAFIFPAKNMLSQILLADACAIVGAHVLILSDIYLLAEADRKKQTYYLETLEAYLRNSGHFTQTAKDLFIDRSTLKYRLQKIEELLHKNLKDIQTIRTLRASLMIYRMEENS